MKRLFSAPTTVNLELTELCNVKCRHCYNFWRDESMGVNTVSAEKMNDITNKLAEGGEPFSKFALLESAISGLAKKNISMSVNSNLMLATEERTKKLASYGVDHILTSLPSPDPELNDYIMNQPGAFDLIMKGIRATVAAGIRVSVNMVITRQTMGQVYEAGKLLSDLGCQKLFTTRAVPPTYSDTEQDDNYILTFEEQKKALDDALRVKEDFGLMIGTLVSYPLCFLEDLDKYADFVGRGCPAQAGHRMSINANGDVHACVHEEEGYGNILTKSVKEIYQGQQYRRWHKGDFHYEGCKGCRYIDICESGCSMTSVGVYGEHSAKDPLYQGYHVFKKHYDLVVDKKVIEKIEKGVNFTVPKRIRFRKEDGFYLLNIRWGNSITVDNDMAEFLMRYQELSEPFNINDLGKGKEEFLANLYFKDAIESEDININTERDKLGLSFNFDALEPAPEIRNNV